MQHHPADDYVYVAPPEPPPSRRPPITVTGPIGWLRANLFSSPLNSLATLITGALVVWFLWSLLSWSVRSAQWAVVYNNLRLLSAGIYDKQEIWRLQLVTAMLVFLTGLGLGLWGRIVRSVFVIVLFTLAVVLIVPLIGAQIPEPSIYILIEPQKTPQNVLFVGVKGDVVTVTLDPLTDTDDIDSARIGYIEQRSRTEWSTQARSVVTGDLDLSHYNLNLSVRILDRRARAIVDSGGSAIRSEFLGDPEGGSIRFTLPADGWYVIEIIRDDDVNEQNQGYAWLKLDGVEIFSGQEDQTARRVERFGAPPDVENLLEVEEKAFRFEGARTFGEFVSVQLSPLFARIDLPLFAGMLLFFNGWVIGTLGKKERTVRRAAIIGWVLALPVSWVILQGFAGSRTLPPITPEKWGGLLLTMVLTIVGITASFPLGVALALGRRSSLPAIKWTCTLLIETIRGVPLITILFMAKLIVPFFWSALSNLDLTLRMMIGLTLFSAAYLAENVRGGLQIVPQGQLEAARALGLNPFLTTTFIVLPQALRAVIPAIVGQFISLFKDTSLVALLGLFELVGIVDTIVSGQPVYRPFQREAYIFVAIVYFVISYVMSDISRRLETSGAGSVRRL